MTISQRSFQLYVTLTVLYLGSAAPICSLAAAPDEVTSFNQLWRLPREEALKGKIARFRAVVLCYDAGWGQLYFHDGIETKWMSPLLFQREFKPGDLVEITAKTGYTDGFASLTNVEAAVLGGQQLPAPKKLALKDLHREIGQWIETEGVARLADTSTGRLALVLEDEGQSCLVYVMSPQVEKNFKQFPGTTLRLSGINASTLTGNRLKKASVFVPGLEQVKTLKPQAFDPAQLPVAAIDSLLNRELGAWTNEMIHLNGVISLYQPGERLEIKDPTGTIAAEIVQRTRAQRDQRVDLWGFPVISASGLILKDGYFEVMGSPISGLAGAPNALETASTNAVKTLTTASEVVHLSKQAAATHIPVRLRGVLTYADPGWHNAFFCDASGQVFIETSQGDVRSGQWVEVRGHTNPGGFAPEVQASSIEILGTTNLPVPAKVDLAELANGHLDAHWVELEGVVRRVTEEWDHVTFSIATEKGQFKAVMPLPKGQARPTDLIDCFVAIRGACAAQLNSRGQLSGINLNVPSTAQIQVIEGVPTDPFAVPLTSIAAASLFDPNRRAGRRVKISGTITFILPGKGFFLQDDTGGMRVETQETTELQPGRLVDVLGFLAMGDFSPHLDEAVFRQRGTDEVPQPKPATSEQILVQGTNDSELVQMEAQLVQDVSQAARPRLILQNGSILFTANLENSDSAKRFPPWKAGSLLRLKAICSIQGNEAHEPEAFKLLVAAPGDVVMVAAPPRWTLRHALILAGAMGLAIAVTTAWILLLRRQVRAQTNVIRNKQMELVEISRQAGMAEVATNVLHNVGNVLTSVTVSATLIADKLKHSKTEQLSRAASLLRQHENDLGRFLTNDDKGRRLPDYLHRLSEHLAKERNDLCEEAVQLHRNIEHIRDIVSMQQKYAKVVAVAEPLSLANLVDDALSMNAGGLERHGVRVLRQYETNVPEVSLERNKVLQILVNLIHNAKYACSESEQPDKQVRIHVSKENQGVKISVADNGIGIPEENLNRIFNHGFTTRKEGHGFGLHSGALAAAGMGGKLSVQSDGKGQGAVFTLELPLAQKS